uniref:Uncharacterized protein n=1 Tax=Caenorhabditis japonica TaxID=281687 RepID=A0A8R1ENW8_CAEJA
MSYKAYIQDLADVEDRASLSSLSRRASSTGLASSVQQQPVTIASYGNIPYSSSSTNVAQAQAQSKSFA